MKRNHLFVVAAVVIALVGGIAAQGMAFSGPGNGPHWRGHAPRHMQADRLQMMALVLELTPAQKTQVKDLLTAERKAMRPWQKQLFESRRELRSATFKGRFDEAKVRSLASKMSQARTELIVSRDRVRSKIYALLTPKQKVLADKLQRLFHHRRNFHRDF